jgi:hypothetical protein
MVSGDCGKRPFETTLISGKSENVARLTSQKAVLELVPQLEQGLIIISCHI